MHVFRRWRVLVLASLLLISGTRISPTQPQQDPFQITTICTPVPAGKRQLTVTTGDELQRALDQAVGGDVILLADGATFRPAAPEGSFLLRNRRIPIDQWVTIRSANRAFDAGGALPPSTRADSSHANLMPKLRAVSTNKPAIRAEAGARGYRLIGLDIGADEGVAHLSNLVELGSGRETTVEAEPSDIVIDRCYLHGNDQGDYRRGVALNGVRMAVVDSSLENFHDAHSDSQAIGGWNGAGPFRIVNNLLEAASENIMFGGADPAIEGLVPSDIEVRRNLSTKRLSWKESGVAAKNAFELKNARRVLVDGNIFEHVWTSGQNGTAIVLKSTNQEGRCTWCVTEYVTFSNNIVRDAASGLAINGAEAGAKGLPLPLRANHIRVANVLFENIGAADWGTGGKLFRVTNGVSDVEITHVTSTSNPNGILDAQNAADVNPNLVFSYNIVERRLYGIGAGANEGLATLTRNFAPATFSQNVLVNTSAATKQSIADAALKSRYSKDTTVVPGWEALGFQSGTFKLSSSSRFAGTSSDGKDPGADIDAIERAQKGPDSASCVPPSTR
ncbi:MAG TPA: hypothetical protein VFI56_17995 [Vicinamibacterales bacterium]|nr:hypothetical protein [Vicinamibacterales bacterium]